MMKRLMDFAAGYPYVVFVGFLLLSLTAVWHVRELQIHISPQSLSIENDPAKSIYQQSIETFGSDNITVLFLRDPQLFQPDKLEAVRTVLEELKKLPYVIDTQSLFSLPNLRVVDDFVISDPYLDKLPLTQEEANGIIASALRNPFVKNNLLSRDGTAMSVNIYLTGTDQDLPGWSKMITEEVEQVISPLIEEIDTVYQVGLPYIRATIQDHIELDLCKLLPLALAVLLITLLFSLRSPCGVFIPLLTAGISVLCTLGLMAALDIPLNIMTALVPVLLIIIGSTEDIHLINEFYKGVTIGHICQRAISYMTQRMGLVVLLTFLTSSIGFLSIATSPIELVHEFGLVTALGITINFAVTILIVPAYLRLFGKSSYRMRRQLDRFSGGYLLDFLTRSVLTNRKSVISLTLAVTAFALFQAKDIQVNNSVMNYFEPESELIRRVSAVHEHLAGVESFSVILDSRTDGGFKKVHFLREVQKLQKFLHLHPAFDSSISFANYLSLINSVVNDSGKSELPGEDEIIDELLLFVNQQNIEEYVSQDFSRTKIMVRHNITSSHELGTALTALERFISANIDHGLDVQITGEAILTNNAADTMAKGQVKSLLMMLVVIFVVISLLFFNPKAGLLALLPNIFLVAVLFGIMGAMEIPLDTGTTMIATIALGVCVDHTMHFMVRYRCKLREYDDPQQAILETIRDEATPIATASLALAAGLGCLMFSSFTPVAHFGALSAAVMLLAFYANFFITPIILSYTALSPSKTPLTDHSGNLLEADGYSTAEKPFRPLFSDKLLVLRQHRIDGVLADREKF